MESPRMLQSRSSSMLSNMSSDSANSSTTDLSITARSILNTLVNDRDFTSTSPALYYISPDVTFQHDDDAPMTSRDAFFKGWQTTLQRMPNVHMDIKEACVDEAQMKVWVRSEITGYPGGVRKESIDMMQFNADGVLTSSCDYQRILKRSRDE